MYKTSLLDIKTQYKTDFEKGLTTEEVQDRLSKYGRNKLDEQSKHGFIKKFLSQFKDTMIIVLIVAGFISLFVNIKTDGGLFEPILIFALVLLNALIGSIQETRAEKALNTLKSLTSKYAKVIRNGIISEIKSTELVVGDIILIEEGDIIPADARIIKSSHLQVDESSLTGESHPVDKNSKMVDQRATLSERKNMLYNGTIITYGNAKAVVVAIGMDSELGRIAKLLSNNKRVKTPLQQRLSKLGTLLSITALICCIAIFVLGLLTEMPITEIFLNAISLAIASIPESVPAIVTIILALSVERMVRHKAIVKELPAVETLGCTSVICTDKTGTLTLNKMTVSSVYDIKEDLLYTDITNDKAKYILKYASLCTNATKDVGDPTERAIIIASHDKQFIQNNPIYFQLPFDSNRKMMTTIHKTNNGYLVVTKGAFESVQSISIGEFDKSALINNQLASNGIRVLAVAYKHIRKLPDNLTTNTIECDMDMIGLIGIIDPPRAEVKSSINLCRQAGIKVVMITGDNPLTASYIAKEVGIINQDELVVTGEELTKMSQAELLQQLPRISVFARVTPLDKVRIVEAWQSLDKVVAMTGDGVNDAPALKNADIGCAMGVTGSDVAKNSADLILTDDNFETIVHSVKEGRGVYSNIKKVVGFLVGTSYCEVITVFISILLFNICPLISVQLLWINLITDSLPAIALGMGKTDDDVMTLPPRDKNEGIFSKRFGYIVIATCIILAALAILAFYLGYTISGSIEAGSTMTYLVIGIAQLLHSYNLLSAKSITKTFLKNKRLTLFNFISLILLLLVAIIPPVATLFSMTILPWYMYLISLGLASMPLVICEILKALKLYKNI